MVKIATRPLWRCAVVWWRWCDLPYAPASSRSGGQGSGGRLPVQCCTLGFQRRGSAAAPNSAVRQRMKAGSAAGGCSRQETWAKDCIGDLPTGLCPQVKTDRHGSAYECGQQAQVHAGAAVNSAAAARQAAAGKTDLWWPAQLDFARQWRASRSARLRHGLRTIAGPLRRALRFMQTLLRRRSTEGSPRVLRTVVVTRPWRVQSTDGRQCLHSCGASLRRTMHRQVARSGGG